ncbi:MAG: Wzz/FepE/Etk N-terminal domain-containing protein, partial [Verrucomicrobiota bacterium]
MNQPGAGHSQPTAAADSLFPGFPTLDLGRLVSLVKKRLWLAALIAACFVGMALAYVFLAPKIFQSSAVIYVDPASEGSVFDGIRGAKQASWETLDALKSMAEGIRNGTVILRVVDRLSLRDDPTFLPSRSGGYTDAEVVEAVSKQVRAELRRGTRLIDISVKDRSPERARDMTTAFVEEFQALIREQNGASAEEVRKRLEIEAENQRERLQEANNRIHAFRIEHADVALDEEEDFVR